MRLPFFYRLHRAFFGLREVLYPPVCSVCGDALEEKGALCPECLGEYRRARLFDCGRCGRQLDSCTCSSDLLEKAGVRRMIKLFRYFPGHERSAESQIIFALKHKNLETLFHFMGKELADTLLSLVPIESKADYMVTYVPRTPHEERKNGYDHARLLSLAFSAESGIPFERCLLRSNRRAMEQKRMETYAERIKNVKDAFCLDAKCKIDGKRVILIDDIVTTGATVSECAKILRRQGGAKEVIIASLALVPHNINPLFENEKKCGKNR